MQDLADLALSQEDWLMKRVLQYAKDQGYVKYTSTLVEAWRTSIVGLSEALRQSVKIYNDAPDFGPDEDFKKDPIASFGILEAERHRGRGVTLTMFLGLMKYYRQSYVDLVVTKGPGGPSAERYKLYLDRFFDRIELGFVTEWVQQSENDRVPELQNANRLMTNEKNKYLTIFESLANPVILISARNKIENMNHAAIQLFSHGEVSGAYYYGKEDGPKDLEWLSNELGDFAEKDQLEVFLEKDLNLLESKRHFEIKFKRMLDVSGKFSGIIVILNDITERKQVEEEKSNLIVELKNALTQVKQLTGFIPICASCKKIRDDQGYWNQIEKYISDHSEAQFSHGICPDCMKKLYPEIFDDVPGCRDENIAQ
jgi:PAS domain-containing protein